MKPRKSGFLLVSDSLIQEMEKEGFDPAFYIENADDIRQLAMDLSKGDHFNAAIHIAVVLLSLSPSPPMAHKLIDELTESWICMSSGGTNGKTLH